MIIYHSDNVITGDAADDPEFNVKYIVSIKITNFRLETHIKMANFPSKILFSIIEIHFSLSQLKILICV